MRKILVLAMALIMGMASAFAYEPTADIIKYNGKTSFVIKNPNTKWTNNKSYNRVKISKDFNLEDFIDKEWHSIVVHRTTGHPTYAISDVMFVTKDNCETITKQELYDLTFDFFKANTKLYKDAERQNVYESKNELSEAELKLIDTLNKMDNKDRTIEDTNDILDEMVKDAEFLIK